MNVSTCDGDSLTRSPPSTMGAASDNSVSAYQSRGSAPRTPASASRASWPAADARSAAGFAGSTAVLRRSATRAGRDSHRVAAPARSISMSSPASSARNRDGRWSCSSPPEAVTISSFLALVAAT